MVTYTSEKIDRDRPSSQKGRITVVETVYSQQPDMDAESFPFSWNRWIDVDEEPYSRRINKVTAKPTVLDFAWIKDVGLSMFILKNLGPPRLAHVPAPEDVVPIEDLTIRVYTAMSIQTPWVIPVGEHARFTPGFDVAKVPILIACKAGFTRAILHALPK